MNQQQVLAIVRIVLVALGTFLSGKRLFPAANVNSTADLLMAVVGPALNAGSTIWALYRNTDYRAMFRLASMRWT